MVHVGIWFLTLLWQTRISFQETRVDTLMQTYHSTNVWCLILWILPNGSMHKYYIDIWFVWSIHNFTFDIQYNIGKYVRRYILNVYDSGGKYFVGAGKMSIYWIHLIARERSKCRKLNRIYTTMSIYYYYIYTQTFLYMCVRMFIQLS